MCALLSLLDSMQMVWLAIPAVAMVIAAGFLPGKWGKLVGIIVLDICAVWLVLRLKPVGNGFALLINQLCDLSEAANGYKYTNFEVVGDFRRESLFLAFCFLGSLCVLLGNGVNLVMTLCVGAVIAYFGISPHIVWLSILLIVAFSNALPKQGRWLPAILIAAFVATTATSMQTVSPNLNVHIEDIADVVWDFVLPEVSVEKPPKEEPPEVELPEIEEPPEMEDIPEEEEPTVEDFEFPEDWEEPEDLEDFEDYEFLEDVELPEDFEMVIPTDAPEMPAETIVEEVPEEGLVGKGHGPKWKRRQTLKSLLLWVALPIALVLFTLGGWLLWTGKKRKQNRAGMRARYHAAAIRGMYLYAKRWRKMQKDPEDICPEVEAIWLEAAYSDHKMSKAQRRTMRSFVRNSVAKAWNDMDLWKRLIAYFKKGL